MREELRMPISDSLLPIFRKIGEGVAKTSLAELLRLRGVPGLGVTVVELPGEPLILRVIVSYSRRHRTNKSILTYCLD